MVNELLKRLSASNSTILSRVYSSSRSISGWEYEITWVTSPQNINVGSHTVYAVHDVLLKGIPVVFVAPTFEEAIEKFWKYLTEI